MPTLSRPLCGMRGRLCALAAAALPAAVAAQAAPDAAPPEPPPRTVQGYVIGAALVDGRDPVGQSARTSTLQPVWGLWVGRFRLSSGGAATLWGVGREALVDAGLSTTLVRRSNASLSASLRWDEGRETDEDDPLLRGASPVRGTLRGRLSMGYAPAPRWSLSLGISQDLLGRAGGAQVSAGLSYRYPVSARSHWDLGGSIRAGNATYLRTVYGLSSAAAARVGRPPYEPSAGAEAVQLDWRLVSALDRDWVVYGGVGVSRLVGAAARSPLVGARQVWSAQIGLAYRH